MEFKKYIDGRTGYRKKRKVASFTDGYNENSKGKNSREIRCESKIAEEDFFRDLDVKARKVEAFTESSLSFLCALNEESNRRKLIENECEQGYKLKNEKHGTLAEKKWKTILSSSNEKLTSERGITLLALIITVVIMIILAAVTINVTLGDGGLVDQAKHAAEATVNSTKSEQEQMDELASQLNDIIAGIGGGTGGVTNSTPGGETNTVPGEDTNSIDTNSVGGDTNSVDTNTIDPEPEPEPLPDGTISIGEPQWQEDGTANVTVETTEPDVTIEYQIGGTEEGSWTPVTGGTIEDIENGETVYVRITDGEQSSNPQEITVKDETNPTVTVTAQGSPTTNSISVSVSAEDKETGMADSVTYTYYIKESSQGDESYQAPDGATGIASNTYTFTGLKAGVSYDIKVEVNGDKAGNVGTGTLPGQSTGTIPGGDTGVEQGAITFGTANWADGKASITISTDTGMQLQYQKNATEANGWTNIDNNGTVPDLKHGDTVYARLTDGTNFGDYASTNILDNEAPAKATIQPNTTNLLIGESLTATVTHSDAKSGVDINESGWVLNTNASAMGTDNTGAYTGKFTTNGETITLDSSAAGTYYLHVLTVDKAGNKTETVSSAITISSITGTVTQNGQVTWSAGKATLVLQSSETTGGQYTIVYKINDTGSWQEYNGTSITGLSHGDKVTACLTNASQTTYGPEAEFEIQDTTDPTVTVTAQGSPSTNSITVTAQAVDNESGMKEEPTYTFQIKTSSQGGYTTPSGASNISNVQYTFTGLTQGTTYDIQVIVNGDVAGNTGTGTTQATTTTVPGADAGLQTGSITASPVTWSDGKASTTLITNENFKIQYQVGGPVEGNWSSPANSPVTVSNLDHGSTVYARLTDGTNLGGYASITILDGIAPNAPEINITSGTEGNNGYYKSNVTVTITGGSDAQSGTNKIRYVVTGAQTVSQTDTTDGTTSTSVTISTDGTSTITAYTVDKAGNISEAATKTINKDSTAPSTASLTVRTVGDTSIAVTARGADSTSGIYSYAFQRSTTSATTGFTTVATQTSTATSYSYTYNNLTGGTTYYLRVVVIDRAGNEKTSAAVTEITIDPSSVENRLKTGDYVYYEDGRGTRQLCAVLYDSSSSYGVEIITMNMVEDVQLGSNIGVVAARNSYNNAISTLNNATSKYLNTTYADESRCVGSVPGNPSQDNAGYFTSNEEWYSDHNGEAKDSDDNYETDYEQMNRLGIATIGSGFGDGSYWLASRYVNEPYSGKFEFQVRYVEAEVIFEPGSGGLEGYRLYEVVNSGHMYNYSGTLGLRPVFHLKSNIKVTGGTGDEGSPYTLGT